MKKKNFYLIILIILLIVVGIYKKNNNIEINNSIIEKKYLGKTYYVINDYFKEEHYIEYVNLVSDSDIDKFSKQEVMNYEEYKEYCEQWNIKQKYNNTEKKYIVFSYAVFGTPSLTAKLGSIKYNDNVATLYVWDSRFGVTGDISGYTIIIPITKNITEIEVIPALIEEEYKNLVRYGNKIGPNDQEVYKPVIYLYPTDETKVFVTLGLKENITCSYPKYIDGWEVIAKPNGDLYDIKNNRNLYALYYESKNIFNYKVEKDGFIVKGDDTISFLEEKLEILGLTEREAEEFIIYWLPKLENNKYNYIRFANLDDINTNMPLFTEPSADNIIRVIMTYKAFDYPIEVTEQELIKPLRSGFTVVELGGTEIK